MKKLILMASMVFAAVSSSAALAQGTAAAQIERGDAVFQQWCAACHASGQGHPGTQALDYRFQGVMPGALEERTNLAPEYVKYVVRNGLFLMPFFRHVEIGDTDLDALAAYLTRNNPK
ncbi:MAG TPA: cytochrome c [Gammaproteobacteria bacterium]|nr:cytochrome c [Gammaproteobacteria bacterium]